MIPADLRRRADPVAAALPALFVLAACASPVAPAARRVPVAETAGAARPAAPGRTALRQQTLASGLRLLFEEDPYATLAGVVSVVRGGSGLDPAGAEGVAHLVEHLSYRALDPPREGEPRLARWDRLIRAATADMNGFTTPDCLIFYELAPAANLARLVELETARLAAPLAGVDEAAVVLERQVVGSEHLLRADPRAGEWAATTLFPRLFPASHSYARPTGGTEATRRKLTLADARAYAARAFRPERITLLVTAPPGVSSLETIVAALPAELRAPSKPADAAAGPAPAPRTPAATARPAATATGAPAAAAPAGPLIVERRPSPLATPELWIGWTLPGSFGEVGATEGLLARWAEEDLAADRTAQDERHIRYVTTSLEPGLEASALFVRALLDEHADADAAAQLLVARVASLWARERTAEETFAELRDLVETRRILRAPGQLTRAIEQAVWSSLTGRVQTPADEISATEAVTSAAVAKLAYEQLTRERAHATLLLPTSAPAEAGRAAAAAFATQATRAAGAELLAGAASWDTRTLVGVLPAPPAVTVKKLPSGLVVMTVAKPATSAVAWLAFRGGTANAEPPLLVEVALRTRPDARHAPRLHMLPGRAAARDMSIDAVEFPPDQLTDALTLLFAKATAPVKEWPSRERLAEMLAPLAAAEDVAAKRAERAFWRALFGDHPYARIVTTDDLPKLTRSDVDAWVGRVHVLERAALVVVGDVTPAEVERAASVLSQQLKTPGWVAEIPAPPAPALRPAGSERLTPVVTARHGSLTDIRLACLLPPMRAADRDYYELLRSTMEARLNAALRIEQGDGYGVSVAFDRLSGGATYLVATTFVDDRDLARSMTVLRDVWRRWSSHGFEASEVNVGRWRYAATLAASYASPRALALRLAQDWSADPATIGAASLRADVSTPQTSRITELFATCKANAVLGLTGDEPAIHRALEQSWPALRSARHEQP